MLVSSLGTGNAGNLTVNARSIRLDNNATLNANTRSRGTNPNREQATITLSVRDLLSQRRSSNITTNATGENVIGGNISINTNLLIAVEDSDISANSTNFRGGQVRINASGIFGTQFRNARTPESDITATGASPELSGTVEVDTPDVDPNRGLISLPAIPVDTQVVQSCTPGGSQADSEFVMTGRGGLPPNPGEALNTDAVQVDLVTLNPQLDRPSTPSVSINSTSSIQTPIVEAQGWAIAANGEVILTANASTATPHNSWQTTANCQS